MRLIDADALYPKIKEYFGKYLADEGVISKEEWLILKHNKNISKIIKEAPTVENYKDLEEQGLLLRLPCKVGDTVWYIPSYNGNPLGFINKDKVQMIGFTSRGIHFKLREHHEHNKMYMLGKTVFLTKEAAEQKLKEMEENGQSMGKNI